MKKINISRQISGIDPKFIEEAVTHKVKRISYVRVVAIAACLAILVTSIPLAMVLNRSGTPSSGGSVIVQGGNTGDDTNPNNNQSPQDPAKIIYCSSELTKEELKKILAGENVEIRDASGINTESVLEEVSGEGLDIPARLNLSICGIELNCVWNGKVKKAFMPEDDKEYFKTNYIAYYNIENLADELGRMPILEYSLTYDKVQRCSFLKSQYVDFDKPTMDVDTLKELADKALLDYVGEDALGLYVCKDVYVTTATSTSSVVRLINVQYQKQVNGFPTREYLDIGVLANGSLWQILNVYYQDTEIIENYDVELIRKTQTVVDELLSQIGIVDINNKYIALADDGKLYWCYSYETIDEWFGCPDVAYIYYPVE